MTVDQIIERATSIDPLIHPLGPRPHPRPPTHPARSKSPESLFQKVLYSRSLRSVSHCTLSREPAENPPHPRLAPRQTVLHPSPLTNSRFYARTFLNMKQVLGDTRRAASLGVYGNWGEGCDVLRCSWRGKRVGGEDGNKYSRGENLDALSPHLAGARVGGVGRVTTTGG